MHMTLQYTPRRTTKPARFPNAIREYRIKARLTQKQVGQLVGRSRRAISKWECGRVLPRLPDVFRLAKTLGTLAEALYHGLYSPEANDDSTTNPQEA